MRKKNFFFKIFLEKERDFNNDGPISRGDQRPLPPRTDARMEDCLQLCESLPVVEDKAGHLRTVHGALRQDRTGAEEFPHGGLRLRVLDLPTLIAVKAAAGRPKDRVTVPILIATLEDRKKRAGS